MKKLFHPPQRGQSLVEFALIIPIFLLLAVMIFDLGRAVYYYSAIHNAAREGARYGVVHPDDIPGMEAKAVKYAAGLGLTTANVTAGPGTPENVGGFPNPTVSVTVNYCFIPVTPLFEMFVPGNGCQACGCKHLLLKSDAIMRTETLPTP
jgi:Flp pilus assembly protein TadG